MHQNKIKKLDDQIAKLEAGLKNEKVKSNWPTFEKYLKKLNAEKVELMKSENPAKPSASPAKKTKPKAKAKAKVKAKPAPAKPASKPVAKKGDMVKPNKSADIKRFGEKGKVVKVNPLKSGKYSYTVQFDSGSKNLQEGEFSPFVLPAKDPEKKKSKKKAKKGSGKKIKVKSDLKVSEKESKSTPTFSYRKKADQSVIEKAKPIQFCENFKVVEVEQSMEVDLKVKVRKGEYLVLNDEGFPFTVLTENSYKKRCKPATSVIPVEDVSKNSKSNSNTGLYDPDKGGDFYLLSPDGFTLDASAKRYTSLDDAMADFEKWKKRFEKQGHYSSTRYGKIDLLDLEDYMIFSYQPFYSFEKEDKKKEAQKNKTNIKEKSVPKAPAAKAKSTKKKATSKKAVAGPDRKPVSLKAPKTKKKPQCAMKRNFNGDLPAPIRAWYDGFIEKWHAKKVDNKIYQLYFHKPTNKFIVELKHYSPLKRRHWGVYSYHWICLQTGRLTAMSFEPKQSDLKKVTTIAAIKKDYSSDRNWSDCSGWIKEAYKLAQSGKNPDKKKELYQKFYKRCGDLTAKKEDIRYIKWLHKQTREQQKKDEGYWKAFKRVYKEMRDKYPESIKK